MKKKLKKETELYLKSLNEDAYNKFIEKHPYPKEEIINDMLTHGIAITHTDKDGNVRVVKPDTDEFFKVIDQAKEKEE